MGRYGGCYGGYVLVMFNRFVGCIGWYSMCIIILLGSVFGVGIIVICILFVSDFDFFNLIFFICIVLCIVIIGVILNFVLFGFCLICDVFVKLCCGGWRVICMV